MATLHQSSPLPQTRPLGLDSAGAAPCVTVCQSLSCPRTPAPPAEHQPPSWSSYFTDLHIASLLAPAGLLLCFRPLTDASMFLLLYGVTAVYFSGVMVRACCCWRSLLAVCACAH